MHATRCCCTTDCSHCTAAQRGCADDGLLQSALARPQQHYAYADTPDLIEMATVYTAGIVRNHHLSMATSARALWSESCFWN